MVGSNETGEVAGIAGCDYHRFIRNGDGLTSQDGIGIECFFVGGGASATARLCPELRGFQHGVARDRKEAEGGLQLVQPLNAFHQAGAQQFSAHLIVSNLRNEHFDAARQELSKPGDDVLGRARMGDCWGKVAITAGTVQGKGQGTTRSDSHEECV